jgi:hypothetical protein
MGHPRYQIPTRLQTDDTVLTLGSLALTMRQSVFVLFGGCPAFVWWLKLPWCPRPQTGQSASNAGHWNTRWTQKKGNSRC